MNPLKLILFNLFLINPILLPAQNPVINEVMSVNVITIQDEDGDYPDWLELYNSSSAPLNLSGYGISDDINQPMKWTLPDLTIKGSSHLLVFASGKNLKFYITEWETVIDWGDSWKYRVVNSQLHDWNQINFNDSGWETGPTGIGYGDGDDATNTGPVQTIYLRKLFDVEDISLIRSIMLHVDYDDAFVAYLNGQEIARANIGEPSVMPAYNQGADTWREAQLYQGGMPDAFILSGYESILKEGENLLALEIHNYDTQSSDMTIIPFLSLGYSSLQSESRGANPILDLETTAYLHTNFKIKSEGEWLILSDTQGKMIDKVYVDSLTSDISYGRQPDGGEDWFFFDSTSPGKANIYSGYGGYSPSILCSYPSGIYNEKITVELSSQGSSYIYYTLDGSPPNTNSLRYQNSLQLNKTTVLRARAINPGSIAGPEINHSYIINENSHLPIVSIIIDPDNLWNYETGIYVMGPNASPENPHFGANFWQDWERKVYLEFFEENNLAFSHHCGVKIAGAWSRAFAQKSMAFYFRKEYGPGKLEYPIFNDLELEEFNSFSLRNSGNDWPNTLMRDALIQQLASDMNIDRQAYKPVIVFLNGEYWGIHNIREKQSEHYIKSHHGVNKDSIDFLEGNSSVIQGDADHYNQLIHYISTNNMNTKAAYEYINSKIDLNNYLDYMIIQIYSDNTDWPGNNIKYWRPKEPGGKWRWLLFDTDFGFGLYDNKGYQHNTLAFALDNNGPGWPNPPWSTLFFRKLMENMNLRNDFINRTADHLNVSLSTIKVIEQIELFENRIADEMPRHHTRWNQNFISWLQDINHLQFFAQNRPVYFRSHIIQTFKLKGSASITLQVHDGKGGSIKINSQNINHFPWKGYYFNGVPVTLEAIPDNGYYFTGWSGNVVSEENPLELDPGNSLNITANFDIWDSSKGDIVINEINYNSHPNFDPGDWLEFTHKGSKNIDLSGWLFSDSDDSHQFYFPESCQLKPDSFIVIARDSLKFVTHFPDVTNMVGCFDFGLSGGGEHLRVLDKAGNLVDSVSYDDGVPWPPLADGMGPTLELINPSRDNSIPTSWRSSSEYGTPGINNSVYSSLNTEDENIVVKYFEVFQNYPNPFNGGTNFRFRVAVNSVINLTITDIQGRQVFTSKKHVSTGEQRIAWTPGKEVASGIYFYSVSLKQHETVTGRMLYLK